MPAVAIRDVAGGKELSILGDALLTVRDIMVRNVRGMVAEPGKLSVSLLGMSFLGKLTRFEMRGRELVLIQ